MGVVRADPFIAVGVRHPVPVVDQDVVDVTVLAGTNLQSQHAGRLQAGIAVALGQLEQAEAGAVAVLWVLVFLQQSGHTHRHCGADRAAPVDQALRRPLHVGALRRGHVFGNGAEAADAAVEGMAGDMLSAMLQFDCSLRDACLKRLAH